MGIRKEADNNAEEVGKSEGPEKIKKKDKEDRPLLNLLIDVGIAFLIVVMIMVSIYLYTQNWPPVVVVESNSMQHSDDVSIINVIDTGDLVFVKKTYGKNDIVSYMEGKRIGHEQYSGYGDVIVYRKNGYDDITPVIHRAIIWLEWNITTNNSFNIPELKHHRLGVDWNVTSGPRRWYDLRGTVQLMNIGHEHVTLSINLGAIITSYAARGLEYNHSGFVTLGDHNGASYDQTNLRDQHDAQGNYLGPGNSGLPVEPIKPDWVIGKARGELPWFGAIKLYIEDEDSNDGKGADGVPENSWTMLYMSLILIFAIPIGIDVFLIIWERKKAKREKPEDTEEEKDIIKKENENEDDWEFDDEEEDNKDEAKDDMN